MITKQEQDYLIRLVGIEKHQISFLTGLREPTKREKDKAKYLDNLIKKIKKLT